LETDRGVIRKAGYVGWSKIGEEIGGSTGNSCDVRTAAWNVAAKGRGNDCHVHVIGDLGRDGSLNSEGKGALNGNVAERLADVPNTGQLCQGVGDSALAPLDTQWESEWASLPVELGGTGRNL
jgi:hypothetical protein